MNRKNNTAPKRSGIDWVVCAAGRSERFKKNGILKPKPLLNLLGISMLERSLSSLELLPQDQLIIITRKDDLVKKKLSKRICDTYPWLMIHFIELTSSTSGQLETALKAQKFLRKDVGVAIWNCDTFFKSSEFISLLGDTSGFDGIIPCAQAEGSAWSFVRTDDQKNATAIAEKKVISQSATVGLYFFCKTQLFLKHAKRILRQDLSKKEIYVSALYDQLISDGFRIKVVDCDLFMPFGTPEQIKDYWGLSLGELKADNPPGTVVVDLDNTLTVDDKKLDYNQKKPRKDVIKKLMEYKSLGFKIIIYTARNMQTQHGDESFVIGNIGAITLRWLEKHKIPFDGLRFGKPFADNAFYIDDKAVRPSEFVKHSYEELIEITQ